MPSLSKAERGTRITQYTVFNESAAEIVIQIERENDGIEIEQGGKKVWVERKAVKTLINALWKSEEALR